MLLICDEKKKQGLEEELVELGQEVEYVTVEEAIEIYADDRYFEDDTYFFTELVDKDEQILLLSLITGLEEADLVTVIGAKWLEEEYEKLIIDGKHTLKDFLPINTLVSDLFEKSSTPTENIEKVNLPDKFKGLQEQIDGLKNQSGTFKEQADEEKKKLDKLNSEVSDLKKMKKDLENSIKGLRSTKESLTSEVKELRDAKTALNSEITTLEKSMKAFADSLK